MTTTELIPTLQARREADTTDSEPRADYLERLEQLNYNFLNLEFETHNELHLAAGYATSEEWEQLEQTYQLEDTPINY